MLVEIMFLVEVELFYFKCCLIAVDEVGKKKKKQTDKFRSTPSTSVTT